MLVKLIEVLHVVENSTEVMKKLSPFTAKTKVRNLQYILDGDQI